MRRVTRLDRHPLYERVVELVGREHVLSSAEELAQYRRDKSPFPELEPAIAVRPGTVEEVQ